MQWAQSRICINYGSNLKGTVQVSVPFSPKEWLCLPAGEQWDVSITGKGLSASAELLPFPPFHFWMGNCQHEKGQWIQDGRCCFFLSFTDQRDELMGTNCQYRKVSKLETGCISHSLSRKGFCSYSFFTSLVALFLFSYAPCFPSLPRNVPAIKSSKLERFLACRIMARNKKDPRANACTDSQTNSTSL